MSGSTQTACPSCGLPGSGNFCSRCGAPLRKAGAELACPACGAACVTDALYCAECGAPVRERPGKTVSQRLPWILSGMALVAFAIAISLAIGESTAERGEGMPPTGAVIPSPGPSAAGNGPAGEGMDPGRVDLSTMTGREAADRLFDRAMRTEAAGDTARARFFAGMGVQAYAGLAPEEMDADARFHVGLLELMRGELAEADRQAGLVLDETPDHLLGLILRARIAAARQDAAALADARRRFAAAYPEERLSGRAGYDQHAALIADEAGAMGVAP